MIQLIYEFLSVYVLYNSGTNLSKFKNKNGDTWAVVTGATDGIGRCFAEQLAEKGFNIVLLSRTKEKLEELAKTLKTETKIVPINFSTAGEKEYDVVRKTLEGIDIGVLVNNVGASHEIPERFHQIDENKLYDMLNLNVMATTRMTRIVIPIMKKQKRGLILNISSSASQFPCPMYSVYSASKSYMNFLSVALSYEYKKYNIHVECLTPYLIKTKLSKIQYHSKERPLPEVYVKEALRRSGTSILHSGYAPHEKYLYNMSLVPNFFKIPKALSTLVGQRKKTKAREKKESESEKK